jgi:hypothetical protein
MINKPHVTLGEEEREAQDFGNGGIITRCKRRRGKRTK